MDWIQYVPFNDLTVNFIILAGGYLTVTDKIIWHTRYEKQDKELEDWKQLALKLLGTTEKLATQTEIISKKVDKSGDTDDLPTK